MPRWLAKTKQSPWLNVSRPVNVVLHLTAIGKFRTRRERRPKLSEIPHHILGKAPNRDEGALIKTSDAIMQRARF